MTNAEKRKMIAEALMSIDLNLEEANKLCALLRGMAAVNSIGFPSENLAEGFADIVIPEGWEDNE